MDGENNGKPYYKWMIWGENPTIFGNTHMDFMYQESKGGKNPPKYWTSK